MPEDGSTPSWLLPGPVRRIREILWETRRLAAEVHREVAEVHREVGEARAEQAAAAARIEARIETGLRELAALAEAGEARDGQLFEALRLIHSGQRRSRERLEELRADPSYDKPYAESEPLVSVVIPTYDHHRELRERAIPSVLAQTYPNFEIVVVGDAAPEEVRLAVESFDDPRISFSNRPYRGPYPDDPQTRWRAAGTPAYNAAVRLARGLWIAPLDDDDAFRPQHLERLLGYARNERLELAYSRQSVHAGRRGEAPVPGIPTNDSVGRFPPEHGEFGVQSALYHLGLARIFEYELVDASLGFPNDWGLCLRMMEAGVRIGFLDAETVDYYPSQARVSEKVDRLGEGGGPRATTGGSTR